MTDMTIDKLIEICERERGRGQHAAQYSRFDDGYASAFKLCLSFAKELKDNYFREDLVMRKIKALFFKPSGKFYTEEIIEVPESMEVWEICDGIKSKTLYGGYKDMPYVMIDGVDPKDDRMYPRLIIREVL